MESRAAVAIRRSAADYLRLQRAEALSHVPADLASLVPLDVGEPMDGGIEGGLLLPPWQLRVDGDRAMLRYTPPEAMAGDPRFWFELPLERRQGSWHVSASGLGFAHAHRTRR